MANDPYADLYEVAEPQPEKPNRPYVGKDLAGVEPGVADRFEAMARDYQVLTGKPLKLNSAFRTYERQAEIYKTARKGYAAPPGRSSHETGRALDIDTTQAHELDELGLLSEFGFERRLMGKTKSGVYEPWHIEPIPDWEKKASKVAATVKPQADPYADLATASQDPYADLSATVPNPFQDQGPSLLDRIGKGVQGIIQQPTSAEEAAVAGFTGEGVEQVINALKPPNDTRPAQPDPRLDPKNLKSTMGIVPPRPELYKRAADGLLVPFKELHPVEQAEINRGSGMGMSEFFKGISEGATLGALGGEPAPAGMETWRTAGRYAGVLAPFIPALGVARAITGAAAPLAAGTMGGRVAASGLAGGMVGAGAEGIKQGKEGAQITADNLMKIGAAGANSALDLMLLHYGGELVGPWVSNKIGISEIILGKAAQEIRDAYYRNLPDFIAKRGAKGGLPAVPAEYVSDEAIAEWFKTLPGDERSKLIKSNQNVERVARDLQRAGVQQEAPIQTAPAPTTEPIIPAPEATTPPPVKTSPSTQGIGSLEDFVASKPVIKRLKPLKDGIPRYAYVNQDGEKVTITTEPGEPRSKAVENAYRYEVGRAGQAPVEAPVTPATPPVVEAAPVVESGEKVSGAKGGEVKEPVIASDIPERIGESQTPIVGQGKGANIVKGGTVELAPETTPTVYQDEAGWWRVEGTDVKTSSKLLAEKAAGRVKPEAPEAGVKGEAKTLDAQNFPGYETLAEIENNIGKMSNRSISDIQRRHAGQLIDAIRNNDQETISKILKIYEKELGKGDVQGGPKQIKVPDYVRKNIAHVAVINLNRLKSPTPPPAEKGKEAVDKIDKMASQLDEMQQGLKAEAMKGSLKPATPKEIAILKAERQHELPFERYVMAVRATEGGYPPFAMDKTARDFHRQYVEKALAANLPVPAHVLAEYPDLAPKQGRAGGEGVKPIRFETGKALTKEQKQKVLESMGDVYRDANLPKDELKGEVFDSGDPIYGYPYTPDLFIKSDITGKMIRHYVKLPDGRIAHPSELFPEITESVIQRHIREAKFKTQQQKLEAKYDREARLKRIAPADDPRGQMNGANENYHRTGRKIAESYFAQNDKGEMVRVDGKDPKDVAFYKEQGFKATTEPVKPSQSPDLTAARALRDKFGTSRKVGKPEVGVGSVEGMRKVNPSSEMDYQLPKKEFIEAMRNGNPYGTLTADEESEGYRGKLTFEHNGDKYTAYFKPEKRGGAGIRSVFNHPAYYDVYRQGDKFTENPFLRIKQENVKKTTIDDLTPVSKKGNQKTKESPLSRASDRGDLRGVIKGLGGIKSTSNILKNFSLDERKKLIGLIRTDGMGADVLADTINKEYSHLGYYETDADLIRTLVDGSYKKLLNENILAEEEAYYARQIDVEVERTGVSEVDLTEAERIAEAEVAREEIAGRSVKLEEADLSWDFEGAVKPKQTRLEALTEAYPELDAKNLALVLKTFPDGPTDQIVRMAKDPKAFNQLRQQRLKKLSDAGGDADQMQALPGMGGLFEEPAPAKPEGEVASTKKPVRETQAAKRQVGETQTDETAPSETKPGAVRLYSLKQARALAPTFHSQMATYLETKLPGKGSGADLAGLIEGWAAKGQFKADELKWSGLLPWLREQSGPVTKQQVLDKLKEGMVEVQVVEKGDFKTLGKWDVFDPKDGNAIKGFETEAEAKEYAESHGLDYGKSGEAEKGTTGFQSYLTDLPESFTNRREILLTVPISLPQGWKVQEVPDLLARRIGRKDATMWEVLDEQGKQRATQDTRQSAIDLSQGMNQFRVSSSHAYGDPAADVNRFAHLFTADYVDPATGKKYLVVTELQSDWAAKGRKEGYKQGEIKGEIVEIQPPPIPGMGRVTSVWELRIEGQEPQRFNFKKSAEEKLKELNEAGVPPLPFAKNWMEVALKQAIRYAAENGYDGVMVVNGDMVKSRYDLSKHIDYLEYVTKDGKTGTIIGNKGRERVIKEDNVPIGKLADYVGKDAAEKLLSNENDGLKGLYQLEGGDLKIGGNWANNLYDRTIPSFLKKYVKQWGAEVGRKGVSGIREFDVKVNKENIDFYDVYEKINGERQVIRGGFRTLQEAEDYLDFVKSADKNLTPLISFPIPQSMRDSVLYRGQPLYKPKEISGENKAELSAQEVNPTAAGGVRDATLGNQNYPESAEGRQRQVADIKRVLAGNVGREEYRRFWNNIESSTSAGLTPEFQEAVKLAAKFGIKSVVPVKGAGFDGVILQAKDGPLVMLDRDTSPEITKKQTVGHEIFHNLVENGDPDALKLLAMIDPKSPVVKAYQNSLDMTNGYKGSVSVEQVVNEIAADYFGGITTRQTADGEVINLKDAFKSPLRAFETKSRITFQAQRGLQYMAKRGPPEQGKGKQQNVGKTVAPEVAGSEEGIENLMGGGPITPDTVKIISKLWNNARTAKQEYFPDISKKEMSMIAYYADLPFWRALEDPKFKKVYEVQTTRENLRNWANDDLLGELEPSMRWWKGAPEDVKKSFNEAVWHFDGLRKEPTDEQLAKYGLDAEAVQHYRTMRELLDYIWDDDLSHLLSNLGMPKNRIEELRRARGKISGFFPHLREGKYFVYAKTTGTEWATRNKKDGSPVIYKSEQSANSAADFLNKNKPEGIARAVETDDGWTLQYKRKANTEYFELFDDIISTLTGGTASPKAGKKIRELKAEHPGKTVQAGPITRMPEEAFWHVDTNNMQAIIDAAVNVTELPEGVEVDELRDSLLEAVARNLQARGFGEHFIPRKDVPGFDKSDPIKAVTRFIQSYNGYKTKLVAARGFSDALKDINPKSRNWKFASKYVRDMMANAEAMDRTSDKLRAGFFMYFLGGVARQILLQPTQNFIAFVPAIQQYTKWGTAKIGFEMAKASKDIVTNIGLRLAGKEPTAVERRMSADEISAMEVSRKRGILADQLTREYGTYLLSTMGKIGRGVMAASQFFIGNAEKFNRQTAWLVAYRVATQELKYDRLKAIDFAEKMVEMAHFRYGKANLPGLFRGGELEKLLRSSYAFRSYNANLLRLYAHLGTGGTGKAGKAFSAGARRSQLGVLKGLLGVLAFGGLSALWGYKWLEKEVQKRTGKNIRTEIKRSLGAPADLINYGFPAAAGIDLSGSLGMESPQSFGDILGVPYSLYATPKTAIEYYQKGDYYRTLETIAPSVLKGPMKALRWNQEGILTKSGKSIRSETGEKETFSPYEAIIKGASFRTVKEAEMQRRREAKLNVSQPTKEARQALLDAYRIAVKRHGSGSPEVQEIIKQHNKFNEQLAEKGINWIPKLNFKSRLNARREKETKYQRRERQAFP